MAQVVPRGEGDAENPKVQRGGKGETDSADSKGGRVLNGKAKY